MRTSTLSTHKISCSNLAFFHISTTLLLLWMPKNSESVKCFTCHGLCFNNLCNCHMGLCEGDQCFSERTVADRPFKQKISKGCMKRPARTSTGCDYDIRKDQLLCVCRGDFCNDIVPMGPNPRRPALQTVTCSQCHERDRDCDRTCQGHWCYGSGGLIGSSGCGFGPPSLPFSYKDWHLLRDPDRHRQIVCSTVTRGSTASVRTHCICGRDFCNTDANRPRMMMFEDGIFNERKLLNCFNCEISAAGNAIVPPECRKSSGRCRGHFCTFSTQRQQQQQSSVSRTTIRQGCINVTDPMIVQLGCSQKWMGNSQEDINCACDRDFCNANVRMAHLSSAMSFITSTLFIGSIMCLYFVRFYIHLFHFS